LQSCGLELFVGRCERQASTGFTEIYSELESVAKPKCRSQMSRIRSFQRVTVGESRYENEHSSLEFHLGSFDCPIIFEPLPKRFQFRFKTRVFTHSASEGGQDLRIAEDGHENRLDLLRPPRIYRGHRCLPPERNA